jgi:hypothetical protein
MTPLEATLVRAARDAGQSAADCARALELPVDAVAELYAEPRPAPPVIVAPPRRRGGDGVRAIHEALLARSRRIVGPSVDGLRGPAQRRVG